MTSQNWIPFTRARKLLEHVVAPIALGKLAKHDANLLQQFAKWKPGFEDTNVRGDTSTLIDVEAAKEYFASNDWRKTLREIRENELAAGMTQTATAGAAAPESRPEHAAQNLDMRRAASAQVAANLRAQLDDVRTRIANAQRPRKVVDPLPQFRLPALQEKEAQLVRQIAGHDEDHARKFPPIVTPAAPADPRDVLIRELQAQVARLTDELRETREQLTDAQALV